MSKTTLKRSSAEFKAKVALEWIRGELTISQLGAKHGVHRTMINAWKALPTDRVALQCEEAEDIGKSWPQKLGFRRKTRLRLPIGKFAAHKQCVRTAGGERHQNKKRTERD